MRTEIIQGLNSLQGKRIKYNKEKLTVIRYKIISSGRIVVQCQEKTLTFFESDLEEFLEDLEILQQDLQISNTGTTQSKENNNDSLIFYTPTAENKELKETLMDMVRKVKDDKNYLENAKQVCNIANAMVKIQKAELEHIKLKNRF